MKKTIIASIVGGLILFIWQFLSWSMLNVHGSTMQYSPNQEKILEYLESNLEEGAYFLPTVAPGTSAEDAQKYMDTRMGKPWAKVQYHDAFEMSMPLNMARGLIIDILCVFFLTWLLSKFAKLEMKDALIASLMVGLIGYFTISYLSNIWFNESTLGYLIDTFVSWGLVGLWLGFWLPRNRSMH